MECQSNKNTEKLLFNPLLRWNLDYGLEMTVICRSLLYEFIRPFAWFPEEVTNAKTEGYSNVIKTS